MELGDLGRASAFQHHRVDHVALEPHRDTLLRRCPLCPETSVYDVMKLRHFLASQHTRPHTRPRPGDQRGR
jgi:hypothetical protein